MKAHRILLTFGLVLASVVVVGGGAQAAERPNDRGGTIGVGAAQLAEAPPDAFERAVLRNTSTPPPDAFERAVLRQASATVRPDDRAVRGPGAGTTVLSVGATPTGDDFGWADVLVGAAGMLGVVLLGAATTLTIRHRRRVILR
jgi:hypothetical protein